MRWTSIFSEVGRTLWAFRLRTFLSIGVISFFAFGTSFAEVETVHSLVIEAQHYQSAGAAIETVALPGQIDGRLCEGLLTVQGINRAGAIREVSDGIVIAAMPSATLPLYEATPSFVHFLGVDGEARGIYLSAELAERLGVTRGETISTNSEPVQVAGVFQWSDRDGRRPFLEYSVVATVPVAGQFDECWAETWPQSELLGPLLFSTVMLKTAGDSAKLSSVNTTLGSHFSGARRFQSRITQLAPIWSFLFTLLAGAFLAFWRRLEFASARHHGMSSHDIFIVVFLEGTVVSLIAVVLSAAALLISDSMAGGYGSSTLLLGMKVIISALIGYVTSSVFVYSLSGRRSFYRHFTRR